MSPNGPRAHYAFKRLERDAELRQRLREQIAKRRAAGTHYPLPEWTYAMQYASDEELDKLAEANGIQRRIVEDQA